VWVVAGGFRKASSMGGRRGSSCPGRIGHGPIARRVAQNTLLVTLSQQVDALPRLIPCVVVDVISTRRKQQQEIFIPLHVMKRMVSQTSLAALFAMQCRERVHSEALPGIAIKRNSTFVRLLAVYSTLAQNCRETMCPPPLRCLQVQRVMTPSRK